MKEEGGGGGRGGQKGWPYRCLLPPADTQVLWDFTLGLQRREDWNLALPGTRPGQNQNSSSLQRGGVQFSSVQSFSHVQLFATPGTVSCQASLSITNSQSLLELMSVELVMPSSHLILCRPLLLLPSLFPSMGVFSNELALCIRWPKCWEL